MTVPGEINLDPVVAVEREIDEFFESLETKNDMNLVGYSHIMERIWTMDRTQLVMLLNSIMPRFIQAGADLRELRNRSSMMLDTLRRRWPPIGVPPCTADVELAVTHDEKGRPDPEVRITDPTYGAQSTEHGVMLLENDRDDQYLVLCFSAKDVRNSGWFNKWIRDSLDEGSESAPRGLSIGLWSPFDLNDNNPLNIRSQGFREKDGELQIVWDTGVAYFGRVLPVQVKEFRDVDQDEFVYVTLLLDAPWEVKNDETE